MNWGGFAGGFATGFTGGVSMGKALSEALKQKKIEDVRAQGMEEAKAARAAAVEGAVQEAKAPPAASVGITGKPAETVTTGSSQPTESVIPNPENATGATVTPVTSPTDSPDAASAKTAASGMVNVSDNQPAPAEKKITPQAQAAADKASTPATPASEGLPFVVNGKGYATREEARAAADKATPDMMTFIGKTMVPRLQQTYMEQGDIEKADAWGKWAEDKKNQAAMKQWAGAYRAAQIGDYEAAADHVFELYKNYDDGITPLSKETVKDKDGNVTGFNVTLKVDATGEKKTQFIDRKSLTEMGLSALSPPQMFELQYKRQVEADKMAAAAAIDNAKSNRDFKEKVVLQDRKHENDLERDAINSQLDEAKLGKAERAKFEAKRNVLREQGLSDEFIASITPELLGVNGDYKKRTSPEEARRLAFSDRVKSDPLFGRKSPEEQKKILDGDMALIYGGVKPSSVPSAAAPSAPAAGLPQPSAAPAGKKGGVPVYDTKTGQIIYR